MFRKTDFTVAQKLERDRRYITVGTLAATTICGVGAIPKSFLALS